MLGLLEVNRREPGSHIDSRTCSMGIAIIFSGGDVAQLAERCLRKAEVGGSIPLISTRGRRPL